MPRAPQRTRSLFLCELRFLFRLIRYMGLCIHIYRQIYIYIYRCVHASVCVCAEGGAPLSLPTSLCRSDRLRCSKQVSPCPTPLPVSHHFFFEFSYSLVSLLLYTAFSSLYLRTQQHRWQACQATRNARGADANCIGHGPGYCSRTPGRNPPKPRYAMRHAETRGAWQRQSHTRRARMLN